MPKLIGSAPNQVSVNGMLGDMAFQSSDAVTVAKLDVAGSIGNVQVASGGDQIAYTFNGYNYLTATGASATIQIQATGASGRLTFATAGSERMRIDTNGNLIVGATSATFRLQVETNADGNAGAFIRNSNTGTSASGTAIVASGVGNLTMRAHSAAHTAWPNATLIQSDSGFTGGLNIFQFGANPIAFWTNGSERVRVASDGKVGIGTTGATALLDVNSDTVRVRTAKTPASATATGNAGDICWDANYVYVCTATNTWKRAALSTW